MLSRLLPKAASNLRALTLISSPLRTQHQTLTAPKNPPFNFASRFFSTDGGGGGDGDGRRGDWNLSDTEQGSYGARFPGGGDSEPWASGGGDAWDEEDNNLKPWNLAEEEEGGGDVEEGLFDIDVNELASDAEAKRAEIARAKEEEAMRLEREEQALTAILKGPRRAFGDLITASGITEEMIDSLIALKDFKGVEGLPPLKDLEELRKEKGKRKSSEAEKERLKQEEAAKARVRQVDVKGRAYGTGRRKCSVARVWIQPGDGKFVVNGKDFDVYFPILDYRAALLRPFSETKTLGLWDVNCTVKGGGVTGQCGAILLGISRALQNWEPDLRPPLKAVGFLTRDPRMVERKKPGKAKARKSFQWVKR